MMALLSFRSIRPIRVVVAAVLICPLLIATADVVGTGAKPRGSDVGLKVSLKKRQAGHNGSAASARIRIGLVRGQRVSRFSLRWKNTSFIKRELPLGEKPGRSRPGWIAHRAIGPVCPEWVVNFFLELWFPAVGHTVAACGDSGLLWSVEQEPSSENQAGESWSLRAERMSIHKLGQRLEPFRTEVGRPGSSDSHRKPRSRFGFTVNQGIDENVFAAVSARRQAKYPEEALVGWVAIHQYSKLLLAADEDQIPWWVGGWPVAVNWPGEPWEQGPFPQVENVTQQLSTSLSGEPEFDKIDLGLTEFGFGISQFFIKRYNFMADVLMRASYIGSALDSGIEHAQTWGLLNDQGFAFGLIGQGPNYAASSTLPLSGARITSRQFTPSFHLYKMYGRLFGDQLLPIDFDSSKYYVDDLMPQWETPYVSAHATRDSASSDLTLAFINRDLSGNRVVDINLPGSSFNTVQVAVLRSTEPYDSNEDEPDKVVPSAYHFKINSPHFKFRLRPLSITFLRFKDL